MKKKTIIIIITCIVIFLLIIAGYFLLTEKKTTGIELEKNVKNLKVEATFKINSNAEEESVDVYIDNVDYIVAVKNEKEVFLTTFADRKLVKWTMQNDIWNRDEFAVIDIPSSNLSNLYQIPLESLVKSELENNLNEIKLSDEDKDKLIALLIMISTQDFKYSYIGDCICKATVNNQYIEKYECHIGEEKLVTLSFSNFNKEDTARKAYEGNYKFE